MDDFPDLFAITPKDLGRTNIITHVIDTGDHPPIRIKPYQTNPIKSKIIHSMVKELVDCGHVMPSVSEWRTNVVLVPKPDGSFRYTLDYRQLNCVTKRDSFGMWRIHEIIQQMKGKSVFTTLDLASSYFQIPLHVDSTCKTAFVVTNPPSLYEWRRLPMGLSGAGASQQRLIQHVLGKSLGVFSVGYLDDVLIFSNSPEEHLKNIREVFGFLKEAGLKLRLKNASSWKAASPSSAISLDSWRHPT